MVVKSVGVLSVGKVFAILQGVIGLLAGALLALAGTLGVIAATPDAPSGFMPLLFGGAALVIFPVAYAVVGFVGGVIGALIYNVVAGIVGGIELVVE